MRKLVSDWEARGGALAAKDHLILSGETSATSKLNELAQARARAAGQLGESQISVKGRTVFEGDRVLFTLNNNSMGVRNGNLGTVESIDRRGNSLVVSLDNGKKAYVSLAAYDHIDLAYAVTTHKGEGVTVQKNAYVLAGGRMTDLHLTYVQASRAKAETRFYTTRIDAGDELKRISDQMSRDRQKTLAHDVITREELQQQQEHRQGLRLRLHQHL
jgi:ATP-dependent exoDNAse (exonuclease V) alpha subunit